jgi:hypothetical protein
MNDGLISSITSNSSESLVYEVSAWRTCCFVRAVPHIKSCEKVATTKSNRRRPPSSGVDEPARDDRSKFTRALQTLRKGID